MSVEEVFNVDHPQSPVFSAANAAENPDWEWHDGSAGTIEVAKLTVYRLYVVGDEIALNVAEKCLAQSSAVRSTLVGARQSESIQIKELPLRVELGRLSGTLGRLALEGHLYASIYNLGVVVLAWESSLPSETAWGPVAEALGCAVELPPRLAGGFALAIDNLEHVL